jgi:hypothetical protein
MAQLHPKPYQFARKYKGYSTEAANEEMAELQRLIDASNALAEGEVVGGLLRFQVADGYAEYLVIKDKPLTLQHVPFFDGYQVDSALIRGLRRVDVEQRLAAERRLAELMNRKPGQKLAASA